VDITLERHDGRKLNFKIERRFASRAVLRRCGEVLLDHADVFCQEGDPVLASDFDPVKAVWVGGIKYTQKQFTHARGSRAKRIAIKATSEMIKTGLCARYSARDALGISRSSFLVKHGDEHLPEDQQRIRHVVDYADLNKHLDETFNSTKCSIAQVLASIGTKKLFSTFDAYKGFNSRRLDLDDARHMCFSNAAGVFIPLRMTMGLSFAPSAFATMMRVVLHDAGLDGLVVIYVDDLLIASDSEEEHLNTIERLLAACKKHGITLNINKTKLFRSEVEFVGYRIGEGFRSITEQKRTELRNTPRPTDRAALQSFLGLAVSHSDFVPNLATMAIPLYDCAKSPTRWPHCWTPDCESAFAMILDAIADVADLGLFDEDAETELQTDGSALGFGFVLRQRDPHTGSFRPVMYGSRKTTGGEPRYPAVELEGAAVIYAIDRLRFLLTSLTRPWVLCTDHSALTHIFDPDKRGTDNQGKHKKLDRWRIKLENIGSYTIRYIAGDTNLGDYLSRHPTDTVAADAATDTNTTTTTTTATTTDTHTADTTTNTDGPPNETLFGVPTSEWAEAQATDPDTQKWVRAHEGHIQATDAGVLYYHANNWPQLLVPKKYQQRVLELAHNKKGHHGREKTGAVLHHDHEFRVFWSGMNRDFVKHIKQCTTCASEKAQKRNEPHVENGAEPTRIGQQIAIDFQGPFYSGATTPGLSDDQIRATPKLYIFNIMDTFSKFIVSSLANDQKATTVVAALESYCSHMGVPEEILMDNAQAFLGKKVTALLKKLNIRVRLTTPYEHESNPIERAHGTTNTIIQCIARERQAAWPTIHATAIAAYNNTVHSSTSYTPFFLQHARHYNDSASIEQAERARLMALAWRQAAETIVAARARRNNRLDGEQPRVQVGQTVWANVQRFDDVRLKLTHRFAGPFLALEPLSESKWRIVDTTSGLEEIIHVRDIIIRDTDVDLDAVDIWRNKTPDATEAAVAHAGEAQARLRALQRDNKAFDKWVAAQVDKDLKRQQKKNKKQERKIKNNIRVGSAGAP